MTYGVQLYFSIMTCKVEIGAVLCILELWSADINLFQIREAARIAWKIVHSSWDASTYHSGEL